MVAACHMYHIHTYIHTYINSLNPPSRLPPAHLRLRNTRTTTAAMQFILGAPQLIASDPVRHAMVRHGQCPPTQDLLGSSK